MSTDWIPAALLEGYGVRLEPLQLEHAEGLRAVVELDFFRYFLNVQPRTTQPRDWQDFIDQVLALPATIPYALMVEGKPAGMSTFMDIRPEHRGLEIGLTWIAHRWQGTHVNPAMKLLMLEHAFSHGAIRVQLKMDSRNLHSRRAVARLGATYEGTLRNHGIQPNGFIRDTVMFSITDAEWPAVERGLLSRLADRNP